MIAVLITAGVLVVFGVFAGAMYAISKEDDGDWADNYAEIMAEIEFLR